MYEAGDLIAYSYVPSVIFVFTLGRNFLWRFPLFFFVFLTIGALEDVAEFATYGGVMHRALIGAHFLHY